MYSVALSVVVTDVLIHGLVLDFPTAWRSSSEQVCTHMDYRTSSGMPHTRSLDFSSRPEPPISRWLQPCPGSHHGYMTLSVIVGFVPNPFPQADLTSRCRLSPRSSPALVHYLSYVLTLRHKTRLAETGKERRKVIIR
ncbi:hypothetical protein EJ05DRAFT_268084 [Pseudovirgaria hyperparasitica]|uniref:Uncharacterized protein n=1 Tax=Pseudovirgaria hyperparasitica TaxID=470096 RepID=A0A6A6VPW2_9PEZI|nr:uncharacterized protein EJ05DRAFT_268084 [Pseudovirgaria hyperparasitica]KAF2752688.1 hypothetical protein EJ05DRAFT_268084 [Pseudovirgaria hyperparasitica]